jgi:hypothetical protein
MERKAAEMGGKSVCRENAVLRKRDTSFLSLMESIPSRVK